MTRDEAIGWASTSRYGLVLVAEPSVYPGYLRRVVLRRGPTVCVEFEQYGCDEGGVYFRADYSSWDEAIRALEEFVGKPCEAWRPLDPDLDEVQPTDDLSWRRLKRDQQENRIPLPRGFGKPS